MQMIELFNRLQATYGARLVLLHWDRYSFNVRVKNWRSFHIYLQVNQECDCKEITTTGKLNTDASKWLLAVAQGKTRDAEGKVA